jgi:hypothetical protein
MKTLVSAAAVAALAGSAFGLGESLDRTNAVIFTVDTPGVQITKQDIGSHQPVGRIGTTVYDAEGGGAGYVAAGPATGFLGFEDYGTTVSASGPPNGVPTTQVDTEELHEYGFVGGVTASGGVVFFDFFYNNFSFATSFGVQFPSAGNFIWTITITTPSTVLVPTEGYHQLFANNDPNIAPVTSGQWFLSDVGASPTIGHNDNAWDNGSFDYGDNDPNDPNVPDVDIRPIGQNFRINIPTPGAAALMGLAGLAGLRRRR